MKSFLTCATLLVASIFGSVANAALVPFSTVASPTSNASAWTIGAGGPTATAVSPGFYNGLWAPAASGFWISNSVNGTNPAGVTSFVHQFSVTHDTLNLGDAVSHNLGVVFAADNLAEILVNGVSVFSSVDPSYLSLINADLSSASVVVGMNTIEFLVGNVEANSSMALAVTTFSGEFDGTLVPAVPEPMSMALWGGLCGVGLLVRARRKKLAV